MSGWYERTQSGVMNSSCMILCAPSTSPLNQSSRARASEPSFGVRLRSTGVPAHTVSSFTWMVPNWSPKTIPPSRPLPMGRASVQRAAGCAYRSVRSPASARAAGAGSGAARSWQPGNRAARIWNARSPTTVAGSGMRIVARMVRATVSPTERITTVAAAKPGSSRNAARFVDEPSPSLR